VRDGHLRAHLAEDHHHENCQNCHFSHTNAFYPAKIIKTHEWVMNNQKFRA